MLKKPLFWETFGLLLVAGILNYIATAYDLYWAISEFDSVVHFFGGAFASMFFLWLYFYSGAFSPTKTNLLNFLCIAVLGIIFVAVSWEIYELMLGEAKFAEAAYPFDTFLDFVMDFLGGLAACFYAYLRKNES